MKRAGWFRVFIIILVVFFIFIQLIILTGFKTDNEKNLDYIIILGAKVIDTRPSNALMERINSASKYLKENPSTKVITTGGLGNMATITEAEAIKRQLILNGIDENRIIIENKSKNTEQNLKLSQELIKKDKKLENISEIKVGIVTNNFHLFRAKKLGKDVGFKNVYGISAKTPIISTPKAHLREFFSVIKYYFEKYKK